MARRQLFSLPVYPFLIAALPLLHFYEKDFGSVALTQLGRSLAVYMMITAVILLGARRVWREPARAALATGAIAAPLFYGGSLEWPRLVAVGVGVLVLLALLHRIRFALGRWTPVLNAAVLVLVGFPIGSVVAEQLGSRAPRPIEDHAEPLGLPADSRAPRPDIVYILADGLAHPAIFQSMYGVPRESFERPLTQLGFHHVPGSRSNYAQTALSLSATLNMSFVQDLLEIPDPSNDDRRPLAELIARNRVVGTLRAAGYRVVTFPAEYDLVRLEQVDARRKPFFAPGFFELHTARQTILPHLQRLVGRGPADLEFALHRRRVEFVLRELPRARDAFAPTEPVFVFAHIIAPHPPFVYGRHGEALRSRQRFGFADGDHWLMERHGVREQYVREYRDQALYIVERLAEMLSQLIREAPRPLVIVVQGDHGPGSELRWDNLQLTNMAERHAIFNAWYASPDAPRNPHPGMTAVNTFPFLFNTYLGTSLPLLDDRAWYSRWITPYDFSELPRMR